jgi:hypothetical protein
MAVEAASQIIEGEARPTSTRMTFARNLPESQL